MRVLIGVVGDTPIVTTAEETAELIRSMRIRGAGRIARAGASALGDFADTYTGGTLEGFLADLKGASDTILASRPTAVSLWNGLHAGILPRGGQGAGLGQREGLLREVREGG